MSWRPIPGPFIKWFLQTLKPAGIAELAAKIGNNSATAKSIVGYVNSEGKMHFFEGVQEGSIVSPRGDKDFGWGPIFQPVGDNRTFGEIDRDEKYKTSMRAIAVQKLSIFLSH